MSRNYYSELHVHVTWHTKGSLPLLTPELEAQVRTHLQHRCAQTAGVIVHAVNGTPTHVHLCATVPPTLTLSEWIGQSKGGSAYEVNHTNVTRDTLLEWQTGYGIVSFGTKDLPWVVQSVDRQKEHHRVGRVFQRLESSTTSEDGNAP